MPPQSTPRRPLLRHVVADGLAAAVVADMVRLPRRQSRDHQDYGMLPVLHELFRALRHHILLAHRLLRHHSAMPVQQVGITVQLSVRHVTRAVPPHCHYGTVSRFSPTPARRTQTRHKQQLTQTL